ncbi:MIR domain-containing protein [Balamuthia mandrillaris]
MEELDREVKKRKKGEEEKEHVYVGDVVVLFAEEDDESCISTEKDVNRLSVKTFKKKHPQEALFEIVPRTNYKADEFMKATKLRAKKGQLSDKAIKTFEQAKREQMQQEAVNLEAKNRTVLTYGQTVQFRHVATQKYLSTKAIPTIRGLPTGENSASSHFSPSAIHPSRTQVRKGTGGLGGAGSPTGLGGGNKLNPRGSRAIIPPLVKKMSVILNPGVVPGQQDDESKALAKRGSLSFVISLENGSKNCWYTIQPREDRTKMGKKVRAGDAIILVSNISARLEGYVHQSSKPQGRGFQLTISTERSRIGWRIQPQDRDIAKARFLLEAGRRFRLYYQDDAAKGYWSNTGYMVGDINRKDIAPEKAYVQSFPPSKVPRSYHSIFEVELEPAVGQEDNRFVTWERRCKFKLHTPYPEKKYLAVKYPDRGPLAATMTNSTAGSLLRSQFRMAPNRVIGGSMEEAYLGISSVPTIFTIRGGTKEDRKSKEVALGATVRLYSEDDKMWVHCKPYFGDADDASEELKQHLTFQDVFLSSKLHLHDVFTLRPVADTEANVIDDVKAAIQELDKFLDELEMLARNDQPKIMKALLKEEWFNINPIKYPGLRFIYKTMSKLEGFCTSESGSDTSVYNYRKLLGEKMIMDRFFLILRRFIHLQSPKFNPWRKSKSGEKRYPFVWTMSAYIYNLLVLSASASKKTAALLISDKKNLSVFRHQLNNPINQPRLNGERARMGPVSQLLACAFHKNPRVLSKASADMEGCVKEAIGVLVSCLKDLNDGSLRQYEYGFNHFSVLSIICQQDGVAITSYQNLIAKALHITGEEGVKTDTYGLFLESKVNVNNSLSVALHSKQKEVKWYSLESKDFTDPLFSAVYHYFSSMMNLFADLCKGRNYNSIRTITANQMLVDRQDTGKILACIQRDFATFQPDIITSVYCRVMLHIFLDRYPLVPMRTTRILLPSLLMNELKERSGDIHMPSQYLSADGTIYQRLLCFSSAKGSNIVDDVKALRDLFSVIRDELKQLSVNSRSKGDGYRRYPDKELLLELVKILRYLIYFGLVQEEDHLYPLTFKACHLKFDAVPSKWEKTVSVGTSDGDSSPLLAYLLEILQTPARLEVDQVFLQGSRVLTSPRTKDKLKGGKGKTGATNNNKNTNEGDTNFYDIHFEKSNYNWLLQETKKEVLAILHLMFDLARNTELNNIIKAVNAEILQNSEKYNAFKTVKKAQSFQPHKIRAWKLTLQQKLFERAEMKREDCERRVKLVLKGDGNTGKRAGPFYKLSKASNIGAPSSFDNYDVVEQRSKRNTISSIKKQIGWERGLFNDRKQDMDLDGVLMELIKENNTPLMNIAIQLMKRNKNHDDEVFDAINSLEVLVDEEACASYQKIREALEKLQEQQTGSFLGVNSPKSPVIDKKKSGFVKSIRSLGKFLNPNKAESPLQVTMNQRIFSNLYIHEDILNILQRPWDRDGEETTQVIAACCKVLRGFVDGNTSHQELLFHRLDVLIALLRYPEVVQDVTATIKAVFANNRYLASRVTVSVVQRLVKFLRIPKTPSIASKIKKGKQEKEKQTALNSFSDSESDDEGDEDNSEYNSELVTATVSILESIMYPEKDKIPLTQNQNLVLKVFEAKASVLLAKLRDAKHFARDINHNTQLVRLLGMCADQKNYMAESACQKLLGFGECLHILTLPRLTDTTKAAYLLFLNEVYLNTEVDTYELLEENAARWWPLLMDLLKQVVVEIFQFNSKWEEFAKKKDFARTLLHRLDILETWKRDTLQDLKKRNQEIAGEEKEKVTKESDKEKDAKVESGRKKVRILINTAVSPSLTPATSMQADDTDKGKEKEDTTKLAVEPPKRNLRLAQSPGSEHSGVSVQYTYDSDYENDQKELLAQSFRYIFRVLLPFLTNLYQGPFSPLIYKKEVSAAGDVAVVNNAAYSDSNSEILDDYERARQTARQLWQGCSQLYQIMRKTDKKGLLARTVYDDPDMRRQEAPMEVLRRIIDTLQQKEIVSEWEEGYLFDGSSTELPTSSSRFKRDEDMTEDEVTTGGMLSDSDSEDESEGEDSSESLDLNASNSAASSASEESGESESESASENTQSNAGLAPTATPSKEDLLDKQGCCSDDCCGRCGCANRNCFSCFRFFSGLCCCFSCTDRSGGHKNTQKRNGDDLDESPLVALANMLRGRPRNVAEFKRKLLRKEIKLSLATVDTFKEVASIPNMKDPIIVQTLIHQLGNAVPVAQSTHAQFSATSVKGRTSHDHSRVEWRTTSHVASEKSLHVSCLKILRKYNLKWDSDDRPFIKDAILATFPLFGSNSPAIIYEGAKFLISLLNNNRSRKPLHQKVIEAYQRGQDSQRALSLRQFMMSVYTGPSSTFIRDIKNLIDQSYSELERMRRSFQITHDMPEAYDPTLMEIIFSLLQHLNSKDESLEDDAGSEEKERIMLEQEAPQLYEDILFYEDLEQKQQEKEQHQIQRFMHTQPRQSGDEEDEGFNLVQLSVKYLKKLRHLLVKRNISLAIQIFETLQRFVEGCTLNRDCVVYNGIHVVINELLQQAYVDKSYSSTNFDSQQIHDLTISMLELLLSLVEGNPNTDTTQLLASKLEWEKSLATDSNKMNERKMEQLQRQQKELENRNPERKRSESYIEVVKHRSVTFSNEDSTELQPMGSFMYDQTEDEAEEPEEDGRIYVFTEFLSKFEKHQRRNSMFESGIEDKVDVFSSEARMPILFYTLIKIFAEAQPSEKYRHISRVLFGKAATLQPYSKLPDMDGTILHNENIESNIIDIGHIEIITEKANSTTGRLQSVYFPLTSVCRRHNTNPKKQKDSFSQLKNEFIYKHNNDQVWERATERIISFLKWSEGVLIDLEHEDSTQNPLYRAPRGFLRHFATRREHLVAYPTYLLALIINIIILATFSGEREKGFQYDWARWLVLALGIIHTSLSGIVLFTFLTSRAAVINSKRWSQYLSHASNHHGLMMLERRLGSSKPNGLKNLLKSGDERKKMVLARLRRTSIFGTSWPWSSDALVYVRYYAWSLWYIGTHPFLEFHLAYFVTSVLGTAFWPFFFCFHLFSILAWSTETRNILRTLRLSVWRITLTAALLVPVMYVFAIVAYLLFQRFYEEDNNEYCDTVLECLVTNLQLGIPFEGTLLEKLSTYKDDDTFWIKAGVVIYYIGFWVVVGLILLNIVLAIIVDTFGQLRDNAADFKNSTANSCFICSLTREVFQKYGGREMFHKHTQTEHNFWHYVYFFAFLKQKYHAIKTERKRLKKEKQKVWRWRKQHKITKNTGNFYDVNDSDFIDAGLLSYKAHGTHVRFTHIQREIYKKLSSGKEEDILSFFPIERSQAIEELHKKEKGDFKKKLNQKMEKMNQKMKAMKGILKGLLTAMQRNEDDFTAGFPGAGLAHGASRRDSVMPEQNLFQSTLSVPGTRM